MRVQQLWNAMYVQGVTDFDGITTLAKPLRQEFAAAFAMARPEVVTAHPSRGTPGPTTPRAGPT